ncbi:hypothetical protein JCM15519_27040 [Fundidesulfovibrio butyratiphilus]
MDYLDIKDAQPGDIVVWYDPSRGVHHTSVYSGEGNVIGAGRKEVTEQPYKGLFNGVTPIVRRYK